VPRPVGKKDEEPFALNVLEVRALNDHGSKEDLLQRIKREKGVSAMETAEGDQFKDWETDRGRLEERAFHAPTLIKGGEKKDCCEKRRETREEVGLYFRRRSAWLEFIDVKKSFYPFTS